MRTRSRNRLGWAAAAALAVVVGAPSLAEAQQGGLFPLAPIRRQRTPCAAEDPVYRIYRREYFGYHPTCWRKFPNGWGCPSPEAPNAEQEFKERPRTPPPDERGLDTGPESEGEEAMPGRMRPDGETRDNLPPVPGEERSPFELDKPKGSANPNAPEPPDDEMPAAPGGNAPRQSDEVSPGESALAPVIEPSEQPLLALPEPNLPAAPNNDTPPPPGTVVPGPGGGFRDIEPSTSAAPAASAAPTQVARRSGVIGNLFGGRLFRRR